MFPEKLKSKLNKRHQDNAFRTLKDKSHLIDFSSNDYLGFSGQDLNANDNVTRSLSKRNQYLKNGSTGSRLLSGHSQLFNEVELQIAKFHNVESALIFNSGYDANLGLLSSVLQRGDVVLFDELCHASIRDGIRMSNAKAVKFKHNDLDDLKCHLERSREVGSKVEVYLVTESIFSMDGDAPDLTELVKISKKFSAHLIVDEAHALGVFGNNGEGLVQKLGLENDVLARVVTYGKGLGCHGASVLGSQELKNYLINFSRPFIFTTALSPHSVKLISEGYRQLLKLSEDNSALKHLQKNIAFFKAEAKRLQLHNHFLESDSAIQSCIISGNASVKKGSEVLEKQGYDVRPILSPTVPAGEERLRFCLHSYNSVSEITQVLQHLATFVNNGR